jgi:hypothetical protein
MTILYFEKPIELENYIFTNVKGDGNCFYRAIGVFYNLFKENDEGYKVVKKLMYDHVLAHPEAYEHLGNP